LSKHLRRHEICEYINYMGSVSFRQLKEKFPTVSEMTLRTDLKELFESGEIVRTRGGARSIRETTHANDLYFQRLQRNMNKKLQIALKAQAYLKEQLEKSPNLTIYLGPGSTCTEIAKHFPDEWCTVVTSSISAAYALSALKKPNVVVNGGTLNRFNCSCDSAANLAYLDRFNFDIMFLSVAGYSEDVGFCCVKEIMDDTIDIIVNHSKKVIIPIDSTKFGVEYPITHAKLEDVDIIISDDEMSEELRQHFAGRSVQVM